MRSGSIVCGGWIFKREKTEMSDFLRASTPILFAVPCPDTIWISNGSERRDRLGSLAINTIFDFGYKYLCIRALKKRIERTPKFSETIYY